MTSRHVVKPISRLSGRIRVPGDKSISHRALLVAGVGEGDCTITGLSDSLDVRSTRAALGRLAVVTSHSNPEVETHKLSTQAFDWEVLVKGRGWDGLMRPDHDLDCGNSGTTVRCLLGVLAGRPLSALLDGDQSLRSRPMLRVVDPLRRMGARIEGESGADRLPLRIQGGPLSGIEHRSPVASAQVKTCLLLAGLQASGRTTVEEPSSSRDHTERLLEYLGVPIEKSIHRVSVKSTQIQNASSLSVPGDLSSAAFLLVAAAILPGSEVTVDGVGLNPTRTGILDVLRRYGADVTVSDLDEVCGEPRGTVTVRAGDRRPVSVRGEDIVRAVDELPLIAVLGAFAEGETVIAEAEELRVKESDRVASMAAGLRALGASVEALPDGLVVRGSGGLAGGEASSFGDHRIAMALAVGALAAQGPTQIEGWESVGVSYPGFLNAVDSMAVP